MKQDQIKTDNMHKKYFIENLNNSLLFNAMFDNDEEGTTFLEFGDEVQNAFNEFQTKFEQISHQLIDLGLEQGFNRDKEIDLFQGSLNVIIDNNRFLARVRDIYKITLNDVIRKIQSGNSIGNFPFSFVVIIFVTKKQINRD